MEEITGFKRKDCVSLPGLRWKHSNLLRTEVEPIYKYDDKSMRRFVCQRVKKRRLCAFIEY